MGAVEQAFPESIDEILAMVQETPRGRWFLEGYEKRLRSTETDRILSSIAKLESHIQNVSGNEHDHALLQKAREAIAHARRDIAAIDQKPAELSAEGQLFAKLATLSKQSFSGQPAVSKGVERALRLVSDLDQQLSPQPADLAAAPAPVALVTAVAEAKPAQFFKQDDAIFEPAPAPQPLVNLRRGDAGEAAPRGAKLVIQHKALAPKLHEAAADVFSQPAEETSAAPTHAATADAPPKAAPQAFAPVLSTEQPAASPQEPTASQHGTDSGEMTHSRIVIIRRKAEDLESLPLLEPASEDSSATAA